MSDPVNILVIDADPARAGEAAEILAGAGYAVRCEPGVENAQAAALDGSCDLVILWHDLRGAADLCELVKTHEPSRHVQILVAAPPPHGAGREFRVWADEFVPMPIEPADLIRRVKSQVRVKRCQEDLTRRSAGIPADDDPCLEPGDAAGRLPADAVRLMAHELNQPLTSIMGYAEMLKRRLPAGSADRRYAETIFTESERLSAIVRRLGRMARGEPDPERGNAP